MQGFTRGRLLYAAIFLFHIVLYLGAELIRIRGAWHKDLALGATFFALVTAAVAVLAPRLFPVESTENGLVGEDKKKHRIAVAGVAALFGLKLLAPCIGTENWHYTTVGFALIGISYCLLAPLIYYLYFTFTPKKNQGLLFGLSTAAGLAAQRLLEIMRTRGWFGLSLDDHYRFAFSLDAILTLILAAVVLAAVLRPGQAPRDPFARPFATRGAVPRMVFACTLFFIMNGLLTIRLFPLLNTENPTPFPLPALVPLFACSLSGWLMDRDPGRYFRPIMSACALFFLLVPALSALGTSPTVYSVVHVLGLLGQFTLLTAITLAMEKQVPSGPWRGLAVSAPFICRFFSFPSVYLARFLADVDLGVVVIACALLGALFFALVHPPAALPPKAKPAPEPALPSPEMYAFVERAAAAREETAAASVQDAHEAAHEALFASHDLTRREKGVATLLAQGLSSAVIGQRLHISEHTVNFHVKNILRKFNLGTRLALVAKLNSSDGVADLGVQEDGDEDDLGDQDEAS